jgi:hypothetical protein
MVVDAGERRAAVAARIVFEVDGRTVTWDDVLAWARSRGELDALEREARAGTAALERNGAPPVEDVRAAGAAFRYARSLLSGDEMEAWLDRWGLTTDEWLDHLRRRVARERSLTPGSSADPGEDAVWVDAICSGAFERWAYELASRLAVAADGDDLEVALDRYRERAVTAEALAREIESNRLEWLRVEAEQLAVSDEDVAREVALCAREEGDSLADLADRARGELRQLTAYLDDLEPELAGALLGAGEREILGPLALGDRFVVVSLTRKLAPSTDDPELNARAAERVLRRALDRELESRVRWHEGL